MECVKELSQKQELFTVQKQLLLRLERILRGEIILGELKYSSGPNNQQPSIKLSEHLEELGFELVRFKTGTPPRVNSNTIDYSKTEIQPGDEEPRSFSYETTKYITDQLPCWLTYTNEQTHQLIDQNLHRSPMYSGMIKGTGPRYCPSIEDKVVRFNDKPRHQIFLEPEGQKYTRSLCPRLINKLTGRCPAAAHQNRSRILKMRK